VSDWEGTACSRPEGGRQARQTCVWITRAYLAQTSTHTVPQGGALVYKTHKGEKSLNGATSPP